MISALKTFRKNPPFFSPFPLCPFPSLSLALLKNSSSHYTQEANVCPSTRKELLQSLVEIKCQTQRVPPLAVLPDGTMLTLYLKQTWFFLLMLSVCILLPAPQLVQILVSLKSYSMLLMMVLFKAGTKKSHHSTRMHCWSLLSFMADAVRNELCRFFKFKKLGLPLTVEQLEKLRCRSF